MFLFASLHQTSFFELIFLKMQQCKLYWGDKFEVQDTKPHVELGNYFVTKTFASLRHGIRWGKWSLLVWLSMRMRTLTVHAPRQNIHVFDTSCNVYWHRYLESFIQSNTLTLKTQQKGLLAAKTRAADCGFSILRSSSAFSEVSVLTESPRFWLEDEH